jgi:hypothetical protein
MTKFLTPGAPRGRVTQTEAAAARETRFETAVSATVAASRAVLSTEAERIEKIAAELGIEKFTDPLQEVDARLARAIEVARARIEILSLERELGRVMVPGQGVTAPLTSQKKRDFEARLAQLRAKIGETAAEPAARPDGALGEAVERALAVLSSKAPAARETPEKARARLLEEIDVMEAGRWELAEVIEEHRKEASYVANLAAKATHDAVLVELYKVARQFAELAAHETTLRMVLPTYGLTARSDLMPVPGDLMQAILLLGSASDYSSALHAFGRFLEARGLIS